MNKLARIGIIGTGFIAHGLRMAIQNQPDMTVARMLTRRDLNDFPSEEIFTNSINDLIENCDVIVEAAGDPIYGTDLIARALQAGLPVVTMDAELQITSGTYLSTLGYLTEAEGDQPGALAALHRDAIAMGFKPLVYGNLKGFLNHYPTLEEMKHWADVQGISLAQVLGYVTVDVNEGSYRLAEDATRIGKPISDYLLSQPGASKLPAGVFITAEHDGRQAPALRYLKMGEGPYYTLLRNYHLCHLEIPKTIREALNRQCILLDNSTHPTVSVAAIAKVPLEQGTKIAHAMGSFEVRGEAILIKDTPDHLPIGLMRNTVLKRAVTPGQMLTMDDVEIPETLAYQAWKYTLEQAR